MMSIRDISPVLSGLTVSSAAAVEREVGANADVLSSCFEAADDAAKAACGPSYAMWGAMRNIAAVICQLDMTVNRTLELRALGREMR